jgi:hypothetical protein
MQFFPETIMKATVLLRPLAASTLLLVAACGGSGPANDSGNDVAVNEALGNYDEALPEEGNEATPPAELVSLPPAPADAPATETAPLTQAAQIASEIARDTTVEQVPFEGGWAWRRGGKIVRTASRDGRRVSYFRPGESTPFLVQQGDQTFAYRGGRPERAFDRRGRPGAIDRQRQEEARRLADQSRRDRDQAERAPRRPGNDADAGRDRDTDRNDRNDRNDRRPGTDRPDRSDTGNNMATSRDDRGRRGDDRRRDDRRWRDRDVNGNRQ